MPTIRDLPLEILHFIHELAYEGEDNPTYLANSTLVNHQFRNAVQPHLFRTIYIEMCTRAPAELLRLFSSNSALKQSVRRVVFEDFHHDEIEDVEELPNLLKFWDGFPELLAQFSSMPNISQVAIRSTSRNADDVNYLVPSALSEEILLQFRTLRNLQLFKVNLEAGSITSLSRFPSLKSLELIEVNIDFDENSAYPPLEDKISLERLTLLDTDSLEQFLGISGWFSLCDLKEFCTYVMYTKGKGAGGTNWFSNLLDEVVEVARASLSEISLWIGMSPYLGIAFDILGSCEILQHLTLYWPQDPYLETDNGDGRDNRLFEPDLHLLGGPSEIDWAKLQSVKAVSIMFSWRPRAQAVWEDWLGGNQFEVFDDGTWFGDAPRDWANIEVFNFGWVTWATQGLEVAPLFPDIRERLPRLLEKGKGREVNILPTLVVPRLEWPYYCFDWTHIREESDSESGEEDAEGEGVDGGLDEEKEEEEGADGELDEGEGEGGLDEEEEEGAGPDTEPHLHDSDCDNNSEEDSDDSDDDGVRHEVVLQFRPIR